MKKELEDIFKKYNKKEYMLITNTNKLLSNVKVNCDKHSVKENNLLLINEIKTFLKSRYIENFILILDNFTIISRVKSCSKCKKENDRFFYELKNNSVMKQVVIGSDEDLGQEYNIKV